LVAWPETLAIVDRDFQCLQRQSPHTFYQNDELSSPHQPKGWRL
jgi:hypothetical protein